MFPSLALSYSHISTPMMVLGSATDTNTVKNVCQVCGADKCDQAFLQSWRENIDLQAREMITVSDSQHAYIMNYHPICILGKARLGRFTCELRISRASRQ